MSRRRPVASFLAGTFGVLAVCALGLGACSDGDVQTPRGEDSTNTPRNTSNKTAPILVDVAPETGLDFTHWNGMTGALYFAEPVGSGAALVDLDGDSDLDVVLIQGAALGASEAEPTFPPPERPGARVFRNDLEAPGAVPRFVDVTEESGLRALGYGMGVATGDVDGDGRTDLYITQLGPNELWRNVSEGGRIRFDDATEAAGVDDPRWSTSATFADLDHDGDLDLYVANYVDFTLARHRSCRSPAGRPDYCGPQSYEGEVDSLYLNRGDGTFVDATRAAGVDEPSSGLGVVAADFDRDGRLDLYVANDLRRNFLWRAMEPGDGEAGGDAEPRFEDVALEHGAAVSSTGQAQASMGIVAEDFDGDGDDDLFMTHLSADTNTLYANDGGSRFFDRSAASGLGAPSMAGTGFGVAAFDLENDGDLDLLIANGEVKAIEEQVLAGSRHPLAQPDQLFVNRGDGTFRDAADDDALAPRVEILGRLEVSRGVAVGDVDNDGRSDLLITHNAGPARLLHNRSDDENLWIGLRVVDARGSDALGARVVVTRDDRPDAAPIHRRVATDGSYLSAGDPRVLVGLGPSATNEADDAEPTTATVRVHRLDGSEDVWTGLETNRYHVLRPGGGGADRSGTVAREEVTRAEIDSYRATHPVEPETSDAAIAAEIALTRHLAEATTRRLADAPEARVAVDAARQQILVPLLRRHVEASVEIADIAVDEALREHPDAFTRTRKMRLRNVYRTLPDDPEERADVLARVEALHARLAATPEERRLALFEEIASEDSESQTRFRGGQVGLVDPETLPPPVADAVRALEPLELSAVVEHGEGVSFFLCELVREGRAPSPDEQREKVRQALWRHAAKARWAAVQTEVSAAARPHIDLAAAAGEPVLALRALDPPATLDRAEVEALADLRSRGRTPIESPAEAPARRERLLERWLTEWAQAAALSRHAETIGLVDEAVRDRLRWSRLDALARTELVRRVDARLEEPTRDEIEARFAADPDTYRQPAADDLAVIHFAAERAAAATPGRIDAQQVRAARDVAHAIERGELTFAEAARRHSNHPSAADGGALGWRSRPQIASLGPTVVRALRQMQPGDVSEVLRLESGLWILQLRGRRESTPGTLESAAPAVRQTLRRERIETLEAAVRREILDGLAR